MSLASNLQNLDIRDPAQQTRGEPEWEEYFDEHGNKQRRHKLCKIKLVVIGAGITGLAAATYLQRDGHEVIVVEKQTELLPYEGGSRAPPNLTKIIYSEAWGLEKEFRGIAKKAAAISLLRADSGELLGSHRWSGEMLDEVGGDFGGVYHYQLRDMFYEAALKAGVKVQLGSEVVHVHTKGNAHVTLKTGETIGADVIVGADGMLGLTRRMLHDNPEGTRSSVNMYVTTLKGKDIKANKDLHFLYSQPYVSMFTWWYPEAIIIACPIGKDHDFSMYVYGPADGQDRTWEEDVSREGMLKILSKCEPRVQKFGDIAKTPKCVNVRKHTPLEDWAHEDGNMILIGEAAHPLPPGSIQATAMGVEDAFWLGRVFSHLRMKCQISQFLVAIEEERQARLERVVDKEHFDIEFMLWGGEMAQMRDDSFRAKRDAGIDALAAADDMESSPEWDDIKNNFCYDASEKADEWWHNWGRAKFVHDGYKDDRFTFTNITAMAHTETVKRSARAS